MKRTGRRKRAERSRYYEELVQCRICRKWFKSVGSHLPVHGIPAAEYKRRFGVDYVLSDALRVELSEKGSRRPGGDRYEPRSKAEILRAIRGYGSRRSPLTCSFLLKKAPKLAKQAMHFFGSWSAVREAAGLGPQPFESWSRERIIADIRRRASAGLAVNAAAVARDQLHLYSAGGRHFGSWEEAVWASGLDYSKVRKFKPRTRETVARDLRAWVRRHGPLKPWKLQTDDGGLYKAACSVYGSLAAAARILGLPLRRKGQQWSKERVTERIQRRVAEGRSIRLAAVTKEDVPLLGAAYTHFGSWGAAVDASGFDYSKIRRTKFRTRDAVARDLRKWVREHGPLNATGLETTDGPLYQATRKAFGTPGDAARELGLPYRRRIQSWSRERVIEEVRRRAAAGLLLNVTSVRDEDGPLYSAACTHWGSWAKAAEASGLDYSRIRRRRATSAKR